MASVNLNYIKTDTQMKITINLNEMEHILAESNTDDTQQKKVDYIQPKIKSWVYCSVSLLLFKVQLWLYINLPEVTKNFDSDKVSLQYLKTNLNLGSLFYNYQHSLNK